MLMFIDMGEGGIDEKIIDYVDMGRGLQKFDLFCVKREIRFQTNVYIFNIFVYIIYIVPLHIFKNGQNDEIYFATGAKSDVIEVMLVLARHLYIT